mmetsp:Transcript_19098/g.53228  ORF Transcript_19098/g.53228 Transcript_19098/m.53228 type:complete len:125 (-) Transcript_19098:137-511(-)
MGKATVVFGSRDEALKAKKRYSNMALDGKVMELELADGPPAGGGAPPTKLSSGITLSKGGRGGGGAGGGGASRAFSKAFRSAEMDHVPTSRGRGRRSARGGRRGGGGSGGGRNLDSELDDYMQE